MARSRLLLISFTAILGVLGLVCGPHAEPARTSRLSPAAPNRSTELIPLRPIARIPGGTVVGDGVPEGWTDVVLLARPRLGAGDVSALPDAAARYARMFQLTILARTRTRNGTPALDRVAAGYAVDIGDRKMVITSSNTQKAGLDLVARQVFEKNEQMLGEVTEVGRSDTASVFDAPAIVLRGGEHRHLIYRHFVQARPHGGVTALVWLLEPSATGDHAPLDAAVLLPPGLREDRVLSVKKEKIAFGLPGADALALVGLPEEGREVAFTPELRATAGLRRYSPATLGRLEEAVRSLRLEAVSKGGARFQRAKPQGTLETCPTGFEASLNREPPASASGAQDALAGG